MKSIYQFEDYRKYLLEFYNHNKMLNPKFSLKQFSNIAGFKTPNYIKLLILGKKNAESSTIKKLVKACNLNKNESRYLRLLVRYTHSKNESMKCYKLLHEMHQRFNVSPTKVNVEQSYYSGWYIPVVREVLHGKPVEVSLENIASMLKPSITLEEVKIAKRILLDNGLLLVEKGQFLQTNRLLSTFSEDMSSTVKDFYSSMCQLGENALFSYDKKVRDLTSITGKISEKSYKKILQKLDLFHDDILELIAGEQSNSRVYQFNTHLFPVSTVEKLY